MPENLDPNQISIDEQGRLVVANPIVAAAKIDPAQISLDAQGRLVIDNPVLAAAIRDQLTRDRRNAAQRAGVTNFGCVPSPPPPPSSGGWFE